MLLPLLAILTVATLAVVCWPLLRGSRELADRGRFGRAVYRDQLREVERDLARGVLSPAEGESARLEIQRRLLAAGGDAPGREVRATRDPRLAIGIGVLVVCGAAGLYIQLGSPSLPDVPFAERDRGSAGLDAAASANVKDTAARLAEKVKSDPSDAQAWLLYARTESLLQDWPKAADAYRHVVDLGTATPDVLAAYGEAQVLAAGGIVPPVAEEAFAKALAADPKNDVARYYTALADSQAGNVHRAIDAWLALAADMPDDAPMRQAIARRVAEAARAGGIDAPPLPKGAPQAGPSDEQMAAAKLSPPQRDEMVRGMVAQLATRLQNRPDDVDGWLRLGRSYLVLQENGKAVDAYEHAARLRPDDIDIKLLTFGAMVAGLAPTEPLPAPALSLLRQVEAVRPNQPQVLWYLGMEAVRAGHRDEAKRDWSRLLGELPAGSQDADLVRKALEALGEGK